MFENVVNFFKSFGKNKDVNNKSKGVAKERLHLVLMQDRANISADFLALMKQEIIDVIKKYIDVDENAIDVRLTNKENGDGTTGAPVLYANIPIVSVKEEAKEEARKIKNEKNNEQGNTGEKISSEIDKIADNTSTVEEENITDGENEEIKEEKDSAKEVIEKAEEIVEEVKVETEEESKVDKVN